jgi:hypothetical protein
MGNTTAKKLNKKNPKELTQEEIDYLLKNSHFNKAELIEWHTGFIVYLIFFFYFLFTWFLKSFKERMP